MQNYPKQILSIKQQVQSLKDVGMFIPSDEEAAKFLQKVGYYRLRGYTYTFYDNTSKQYRSDTDPAFFKNKQIYWQNNAAICSEIARSHDRLFPSTAFYLR